MSEPLYPRLLRLKSVRPNAWQRAALGEGMAGVGILLYLADLASAWTIVVLPLAVACVVKAHDVLTALLTARPAAPVVDRVGSTRLWTLLADARGRKEVRPFALLQTLDGVVPVALPAAARVLSPEEQTAALRTGLAAAATGEDPPACAVIAFEDAGEAGYLGYEPGLAVVVDADLHVVSTQAPSVYPDSEKAPTP